MTDAEIDAILNLYRSDEDAFWKSFRGLSFEGRKSLLERRDQLSKEYTQQKFAEMGADGSMSRMRELHAEDQRKEVARREKRKVDRKKEGDE